MAPFSKPETVLKQAEGLVSVGQSHAALQLLTELLASKRIRSTNLTSLEPIILRFLELCVDMRKGRTAKDGLVQYKLIAQNTNVASIEVVIKRFISLAEGKVQEAQEKADKAVALTDVDDLEAIETPESILLGAVSGDQSKDRTDRALVTPWLKFLWESYRTALDNLKNNARLETIYQQIAQQAIKFCLKHTRKLEFRRLCETLRLHLSNVTKYSYQTHSINLSDADTLQHHLDTRFALLNISAELELWQEAFRSVEDIHTLLTMAGAATSKDGSKKGLGVRPAMMANYYEKLTRIFLTTSDGAGVGTAVGGSHALFHAAAWARYYGVVRSMGGKSEEEMSKLAGQVLISALAIPELGLTGSGSKNEGVEVGDVKGRVGRLTTLLGLTRTPTRAGLLKEALSRNVHKLAPPPIQALYETLEVSFDPLDLCKSIAPILSTLASDSSYEAYAPYLPLLQRAVLSRLFNQLSKVYTTMHMQNVKELVKPLESSFEGAWGSSNVEAFLMGCARRGELNARVDHLQGCITFANDAFGTSSGVGVETNATASGSSANIQTSSQDLVRTRLSSIATCLYTSLQQIEPPVSVSQPEQESLISAALAERKAIQIRRAIVARRRELLSELAARQEKEEASRRAEASKREQIEATRRAQEELRRKEEERIRKNIENSKKEEAVSLAKSLKENGTLKVDITEMADLDTDSLMKLQVQQLEKEKKELSERQRILAKRMDHTERAFRKEERALLGPDYERQQAEDRKAFEEAQKARLNAAREAHKSDLDAKRRLTRMLDDYRTRKEVLIGRRGDEFARRREEAMQKIEQAKTKRRNEVMKAREEERKRIEEEERRIREEEEERARIEAERRAEEERQRAEEEAAKAAEEAKKREEEERKAAERKRREAERAADAEKLRLQRQREEEAEARRIKERNMERVAPPPAARVPVQEGGWRRGNVPPASPSRQAAATPPPQPDSPSGTPRFRPPAVRGEGAPLSGWRAREAERKAGGAGSTTPQRPASPAVPAKDDDGFQTVNRGAGAGAGSGGGAWRPLRGRGRGDRM